MKKAPALAVFALIAFSSCSLSFQMPGKVRVKSDAAFVFSSPEVTEENVPHYIDDAIRDNMAGQKGVQFFDYIPPPGAFEWEGVKASLIRYEVDPIEFEIEAVDIDVDVDEITLIREADDIVIPNSFSGGGISFPKMEWSFNGPLSVPDSGLISTPIDLGGDVEKVKIAEGTLRVDAESDGFDYSNLEIKIGTTTLPRASDMSHRERSLNDLVLEGNPVISLSGSISAVSGADLSGITATITIDRITEVVIQTDSTHTGSKSTTIDLDSIPPEVNFAAFDNIGVNLHFMVTYPDSGDESPVTVKGLPIALHAPLLGFSAGAAPPSPPLLPSYADEAAYKNNSGCKITGEDDPLFSKQNGYTLYFNEDDYNKTSKNPEREVWVDRTGGPGDNTGIAVYINPEIDDKYAEITLSGDLKPGKIEVSVKPEVSLGIASVNINLHEFVEASYSESGENPLSGSFPDDEGLNIASLFDDMGDMGKNVNFDQVDLYLYMGGNRERLTDTKFTLTARSPDQGGLWQTAPDMEFENLEENEPPPDFSGLTDGVFRGKLNHWQFHFDGLQEVINEKPSGLKMNYDIKLADHLEILGADLTETKTVVFQPELILVIPLRLRVLASGGETFGSLRFTDFEPEDDIFGRKGPEDDEINEYLEQVKRVSLRVDYDNTLGLDQTSICMVSRDDRGEENWAETITLQEGTGQTLSLDLAPQDFLIYPFRPGLEIRVPRKSGQDYGLIEMKGGQGKGGVRAKISVEVESHVDMEFDF
jgi:hypothetical protein